MKYQSKPQIVDAEVFQWGMEDGILRWNLIIPKEINEYWPTSNSTKYPGYLAIYDKELDERCFNQTEGFVPYIIAPDGNKRIAQGDYILTNSEGVRDSCNPDLFQLFYEEVPLTTE